MISLEELKKQRALLDNKIRILEEFENRKAQLNNLSVIRITAECGRLIFAITRPVSVAAIKTAILECLDRGNEWT